MYNYYFIQDIEITLYMHGENLIAIKCTSMFHFILGLKMNTRFFFDHSSNPTDALSQDQVMAYLPGHNEILLKNLLLHALFLTAIGSINVKLYINYIYIYTFF